MKSSQVRAYPVGATLSTVDDRTVDDSDVEGKGSGNDDCGNGRGNGRGNDDADVALTEEGSDAGVH